MDKASLGSSVLIAGMLIFAVAATSFAPAVATAAADAPSTPSPEETRPRNRAEATQIMAEMRRILPPGGVERLEKVRIGGIDQWVSIRGQDRRNPILLMIHGGPGYTTMPLSWYFQRGWEEYFTVVQWDQRGSGKTYTSNDPAVVQPTLTLERYIADTEEMILWLRKEFRRDRIFVLGHSFGTYLGLTMAERHPRWLYAYVGMAQITNSPESERRGWRFAMDHAQAEHNEQAIRDLQSLAPYAAPGKAPTLENIMLQRKWLDYYGGAVAWRRDFAAESGALRLAPEYTDADLKSVGLGNEFTEKALLAQALDVDFSNVTRLECPIVLFSGRLDYNVNSEVGAEWLARLQAPSKRLVWFEHSAHEVMDEEPGKMLLSLVQYVRPFAGPVADSPH